MTAKSIHLYRIVRDDGLFSCGGHSPRFSKTGKTWYRKADVRRHLSELSRGWIDTYKKCQIVSEYYELKESASWSCATELAYIESELLIKQKARKASEDASKLATELAEYQRLKAKFEQ
jgi:hypothetical protein